MNDYKYMILFILQFIVITGLLFIEMKESSLGLFNGVLFICLFALTLILFIKTLHFRKRLRHIAKELGRTKDGNLKTRLLAQDGQLFNEVIFLINELLEQLEQKQIEAMKLSTARRSLLSSVSHDIRTPLASIIGYIDALRDNLAASEDEKREYLEILSRKSSRLKQLIDEIFVMAKLDANEIPWKAESVDLSEFLRETLIEFLPELKNDHIQLHVNIPERKCLVIGDRLSLARIIQNLIRNALEYGKNGKIVGVELLEKTDDYHLLIWDRGPGILKKDLEFVFERMYRSDQARSSFHGGSGLGLSIAKALVEKNGGTIWVESTPFEKTTFGFSVPKYKHSDGS